jgi:hypothetical protein
VLLPRSDEYERKSRGMAEEDKRKRKEIGDNAIFTLLPSFIP